MLAFLVCDGFSAAAAAAADLFVTELTENDRAALLVAICILLFGLLLIAPPAVDWFLKSIGVA